MVCKAVSITDAVRDQLQQLNDGNLDKDVLKGLKKRTLIKEEVND
jgi:hypothetical protein